MNYTLSNSNVILRALEPEDLDLLYTIENDATLWDVCANAMPYSRFALHQYIANQPQDLNQCHEMRLIIVEKNTKDAIGIVDLVNFSPTDLRAEISIALLQEKREKKFGQDAIILLENYVQHFYNIRLLFAMVSTRHNPIAYKMFQKIGYQHVATLPQWHKRGNDYEDIDILQKNLKKNAE